MAARTDNGDPVGSSQASGDTYIMGPGPEHPAAGEKLLKQSSPLAPKDDVPSGSEVVPVPSAVLPATPDLPVVAAGGPAGLAPKGGGRKGKGRGKGPGSIQENVFTRAYATGYGKGFTEGKTHAITNASKSRGYERGLALGTQKGLYVGQLLHRNSWGLNLTNRPDTRDNPYGHKGKGKGGARGAGGRARGRGLGGGRGDPNREDVD